MRLQIFIVICLVVASCKHDESTEQLLIQNITVIDGNGRAAQVGQDVLVDGEIIATVAPTGQLEFSEHVRVIDGAGLYLVPGFIDMHVHALVPTCERTPEGIRFAGFDWALSKQQARALLQSGITTARSPSTPPDLGVALRDSINAGLIAGPEFFISGELINGRHLDEASVRATVQKQAAAGVDYIKLYNQLSPEAVAAGIDEAHRHGLPVIGHLGRTSWTESAVAGVDFLTHAAPWTEEMLAPDDREMYKQAQEKKGGGRARIDWLEMLDPEGPYVENVIDTLIVHGISLDPTLVAYDSKFSYDWDNEQPVSTRYRDNEKRNAVPGLIEVWNTCESLTANWMIEDYRRMEEAWPAMLRLVKQYHEKGILLTAGSDTPNHWVIPGESLHQEMELLVAAGIPTGEVLRIATSNGAKALNMPDRGVIEAGRRADLVALKQNPLERISNTRSIAWVMQGGAMQASY